MSSQRPILQALRRPRSFLVTSHQNPDADAVASVLVLAFFLKSLGKKAVVVMEDACPSWLAFLPGTSTIRKASGLKRVEHDAVIVADCGDLKRIGEVAKLIGPDAPVINIDHHVTNECFGHVNLVEAKASSTCEILFGLLENARHSLDKKLAVLLYAGIMTDTGSFRYENTSARSHEIAARLLTFKFSPAEMYDRLYTGIPSSDIKRFSDLIHDAQLLDGNRVYCLSLTRKTAAAFSKSFDLKEKIFSFLRMTEGIEVVVILTEISSHEVRVNLRSRSSVDVAQMASEFGGGGHKRAAGCKAQGGLAAAKRLICAAVRRRL